MAHRRGKQENNLCKFCDFICAILDERRRGRAARGGQGRGGHSTAALFPSLGNSPARPRKQGTRVGGGGWLAGPPGYD